MKFTPLKDRVLVHRTEAEEKIGSIIIPDQAKETPYEGIIMAVGDKVKSVKVGDNVLFSKYAGTEILINDESFLIMVDDDILGIFK